MQHLVRVAPGALIVGKPLPWTVYDSSGNVLLKQGFVIHSDMQLEQLFQRGLFYPHQEELEAAQVPASPAEDAPPRNPFHDYRGLLKTLETTLASLSRGDDDARLRLLGLARLIDRICEQSPDASLALVHLYAVETTATEQTLFYGILCHFMAFELKMDERRRLVLLAAALSANLALHPILDKLNASSHPLTEQQRTIIHRHPLLGAQALKNTGVNNRLLLTIVEQHHESPDGQGYPRGLGGTAILPEAQILGLAECYTALITRRGYRDRSDVGSARRVIRDGIGATPRPTIPQAMLKALTPWPPGSLVRLANNEVAVVTHRPGRSSGHIMQAIIDPRGSPYKQSFRRDGDLLEFNIKALEVPEQMPSMDYSQLWGFDA